MYLAAEKERHPHAVLHVEWCSATRADKTMCQTPDTAFWTIPCTSRTLCSGATPFLPLQGACHEEEDEVRPSGRGLDGHPALTSRRGQDWRQAPWAFQTGIQSCTASLRSATRHQAPRSYALQPGRSCEAFPAVAKVAPTAMDSYVPATTGRLLRCGVRRRRPV